MSARMSKLLILGITLQSVIVVIMVVCSFHPILPLLLRANDDNDTNNADETAVITDITVDNGGKRDVSSLITSDAVDNITGKKTEHNNPFNAQNKTQRFQLTRTDEVTHSDEYSITEKIGIILGTGAVVQLLAGLFQAMLIHWIGIAGLLIITSMFCTASPIISILSKSFGWVCVSEASACFATFAGFGCYYYVMNLIAITEKERIRYVNILSIFNGIGIAISYMTGSTAYQFLGHTTTYAIYIALASFTTLCWCVALFFGKHYLTEREIYLANYKTCEKSSSQIFAQLKFLTDPYVALISFQLCIIYICMGTLWATAPNYLITELGLQQWEMGVVMGSATLLETVTILGCTIYVTDHKRRFVALAFFYLWQIAGYLFYPFAADFWQVLIAETLVRAARANHASLYSTLLAYIVDVRHIGDYKIAVSSFITPIAVGIVIGNYTSGLIINFLTFKWLYICLGGLSILATLAFIPLRSLNARVPLPNTEVMLKENELKCDEIHVSRISLGPVV